MTPDPTQALPVTPPARKRPDPRARRIAIVLIAAGVVVALIGMVFLTSSVAPVQTQRDTAVAQRNDLAQDRRTDATTIAALCATGSDVARALDAAGQCGRAREALTDPVVTESAPALSAAQIADIVNKVRAQVPTTPTVDEVVAAVLDRIRADPSLRGASPADVRAIVAAMLAQSPAKDGAPGRNGASFGGLSFGRVDGQCTATVTIVDADGSTRTQSSPVGDGACAPVATPTTAPAPPATDAPAPTVAPAPDPVTPEAPAPASDAPATPTSDDPGILDGVLGP